MLPKDQSFKNLSIFYTVYTYGVKYCSVPVDHWAYLVAFCIQFLLGRKVDTLIILRLLCKLLLRMNPYVCVLYPS